MKKFLPATILIGVIVLLSQFARTAPGGYRGTEAAELSSNQEQFRLKQSYPLGTGDSGLLATIYSCGTGIRKKEILSIWSREADSYELQYIRTAATGQRFTKPELFIAYKKSFIKIKTEESAANQILLRVESDSTIREIQRAQLSRVD